MNLVALLLVGVVEASCPDVRACQERASTWEDTAWFGVGIGWAGLGASVGLGVDRVDPAFNFGIPMSYGGFGLSVPLMAAAAGPSRRAVELSGNALQTELRRRPRYWVMYGVGMVAGGAAVGLLLTDTGPWWVGGGVGLGAAGVLTGTAAGFARDARWIRRQAPIQHGRPRRPVTWVLTPAPSGLGVVGRW